MGRSLPSHNDHAFFFFQFQDSNSSSQLIKEQTNANTTVQQINGTLRQLECTRSQIEEKDLGGFDDQVKDIYREAVVAVEEFLSFRGSSIPSSNGHGPPSGMTHYSLPNDHFLVGEFELEDYFDYFSYYSAVLL